MNKEIPDCIRAFSDKLIDYAGLFPPAKLNLDDAFENFIKYKKSNLGFMISSFVCPVKLLKNLADIITNKYSSVKDLNITVLGRGGYNTDDFNYTLNEDFNYWSEFMKTAGSEVRTDSFEIKLPDDVITSHDSKRTAQFINEISEKKSKKIPGDVFTFFEGHNGTKWKKDIRYLIDGINIHNLNSNNCGFKLRTGGTEADFFPEPELIAYSIRECLDRNVKMKCTAGLHHPVRHFDKNINVKMHGFLNVFGAGIIAMRHNLSHSDLVHIISDENADDFVFNGEYFSWKDWQITAAEIEFARQNLMISFGSCSFDEPVEDLRNLNLL